MKQVGREPKYKYPRVGERGRFCSVCHRYKGMVRAYGLQLCRRCFRERAEDLGFRKYG